jgi:bifunctional non-homologous end joining protein LigD
MPSSLSEYRAKRDFRKTPEPEARPSRGHPQPTFVVQEHHASRLHYDFRLEADGVLKSWAVPKGPSLDPRVKRLAVQTEDHPLAYGSFHGRIPAGEYGAGEVYIWDRGTYENLLASKPKPMTMSQAINAGRLEFFLHGQRLKGRFALIRLRDSKGKKQNWLLIKMKDEFASEEDGAEPAPSVASSPNGLYGAVNPPEKIDLTNPEKVLFPDDGITKRDVFEYYDRIAPRLLPFLRDRPVTLERLPDGIGPGKPHFLQKNVPDSYPDWIPRINLSTEKGKWVKYALIDDRSTLLYLVNQGTLTFHTWLSNVNDLDRPNFVLFDLDAAEERFADVMKVAQRLHEVLTKVGRRAIVKTSGKRGLHVEMPWEQGDFDVAREWATVMADHIAGELPDIATREVRKAKRGGKVYIDVMQNVRGHHAVPPYVLRAVPGAPVSTPLNWSELKSGLTPVKFNLRTIFRRLGRQKRDPMALLLSD